MISPTPSSQEDPLDLLSSADRLRVDELIDEFELAADEGKNVSPEELCRHEPHLVLALKSGLDQLLQIDQKLQLTKSELLPDQIGEFEVIEQIGIGGSGIVFRCRQQDPNRDVAVKVFKPTLDPAEQRRRFLRELRVNETLNISGIPEVFQTGVTDWHGGRCFWIAMQLVEGFSIDDFVNGKNYSTTETLRLFRRICEILQSAHRKGVIHRDIKPSNILVDEEEIPYLLDFGIASIVNSDRKQSPTGMTNIPKGTTAWMSPEVMNGTVSNADVRSDIFSLGVVLFQLLTGKHPYGAEELTIVQVAHRLQSQPIPKLSTVVGRKQARDLETIVAHFLEMIPEDRYQNLDEVIRDIDLLLSGNAPRIRSLSLPESVWRWCSRRRLLSAISCVALFSVLFGLSSYFSSTVQIRRYATELEEKNEKLLNQSFELQTALSARHRTISNARLSLVQGSLAKNSEYALQQLNDPHFFPQALRNFAWKLLHSQADVQSRAILNPRGVAPCSAEFSPDGEYLVTICNDQSLQVWSAQNEELLFETTDYRPDSNIRFSPNGENFYGIGSEGGIFVRSCPDGHLKRTIHAETHFRRLFDLSSNGRTLVALPSNDRLELIDAETHETEGIKIKTQLPIVGIWFQNQDQHIGAVTRNGIWMTWDARTLEILDTTDLKVFHPDIRSLNFAKLRTLADGESWLLLTKKYELGLLV